MHDGKQCAEGRRLDEVNTRETGDKPHELPSGDSTFSAHCPNGAAAQSFNDAHQRRAAVDMLTMFSSGLSTTS